MTEKPCIKCGQVLPLTDEFFYKSTRNKTGFQGACKTCRNQQIKENKAANPERERERAKKWRQEHPEYVHTYSQRWVASGGQNRANRKWRPNNIETARNASRRWRKENPDKSKQSMANYCANNPEKRSKTYKNQRLKKKYGITLEQYLQACDNQTNRCLICQEPCDCLHVDHDHATGQLRGLLCQNCNHLLGHAKDNPEILRRAIKYLADPPGVVWDWVEALVKL